ncbi:MAG: hypothetical protein HYR90_02790 [Candidatus Andersenbacteria bacterium]|nr:hypothetical protein [Candidatus Andersenbacteria bacterium]MBI3251084.1 hypothetical protein [Candidatus Andersenbacteria bacterium]
MITYIVIVIIATAALLVLLVSKRKRPAIQIMPTPKQLLDGQEDSVAVSAESFEKLPPDKAREWLDDFLQKQQK